MKLISYTVKGVMKPRVHVGLQLNKDQLLVVGLALGLHPDLTMKQLLEMGAPAMERLQIASQRPNPEFVKPLSSVTLHTPIADPGKVVCIGMNYVDHCLEQNMPVPKEPVVFSKWNSCVIGPFDDLVYEGPTQTEQLDFEVELVIVIGKKGKAIPREKALEHVAGFTVAHDVSARDWQLKRNSGQWLMGKAMDCFAPIGPCITTTDAIGDPNQLGIRCFLNGQTVQDSNTNQMVFKTEDIVSWLSRFCTLYPGDLILTGTPPGVGCFRKPPLWLKHGDVVTCEIDNIGAITNKVVEIAPLGPPLTARL